MAVRVEHGNMAIEKPVISRSAMHGTVGQLKPVSQTDGDAGGFWPFAIQVHDGSVNRRLPDVGELGDDE
jgi:hypothetical protein